MGSRSTAHTLVTALPRLLKSMPRMKLHIIALGTIAALVVGYVYVFDPFVGKREGGGGDRNKKEIARK